MSRIGRLAVAIPSGVSVDLRGSTIEVKGPAGTLKEDVPAAIRIEIADGRIAFARPDDKKTNRALHGLVRARVANMVRGVTERFVRELEIQGVGYRAEVQGQKLVLTVGYSHPVAMQIPAGLKASVDRNVAIRIEGLDREAVGQFAANVRAIRPPEPYKGKGIRYLGERVRRKVGKAGVGSGK